MANYKFRNFEKSVKRTARVTVEKLTQESINWAAEQAGVSPYIEFYVEVSEDSSTGLDIVFSWEA